MKFRDCAGGGATWWRALVRYHNTKSEPQLDHSSYAALDGERRRQLRLLTSLLRIAEKLESEHAQRVAGVDVQILRASGDVSRFAPSDGTRLDIAGLERKAELFEREFHLKAEFRRAQKGRKGRINTMILYIVRHGIADRSRRSQSRRRKRNVPSPRKACRRRARPPWDCARSDVKPDVLITSPFVRAAQTAEIFAEALGFAPDKIRVSEALKPAADPAEIVKELSQLKAKEVMCFGHAPHVDRLIEHLAGARGPFTELKKAGVACIEQASGHGRWHLLWLMTPKILRELAD